MIDLDINSGYYLHIKSVYVSLQAAHSLCPCGTTRGQWGLQPCVISLSLRLILKTPVDASSLSLWVMHISIWPRISSVGSKSGRQLGESPGSGVSSLVKTNTFLLKTRLGRGSQNHLHKGEALKSPLIKYDRGAGSHWLKHDERKGIQHSSLSADNQTTLALKAWHSNSIVKAAVVWGERKTQEGKKITFLLFWTLWERKNVFYNASHYK